MRILPVLVGMVFLVIGTIMLLLILKGLIRGFFRVLGLLGRMIVGLVSGLLRGFVKVLRSAWSLVRPVMQRAAASVAAAVRFATDATGRGVRRAAPKLAPHVAKVQAQAERLMQKNWSGKDVLIIVLATLVAAPMITVLFVALVPVLVVVGAVVVLQAMFGAEDKRPVGEPALQATPPAPPPFPSHAPPPAHAVCVPPPCRRPSRFFRGAAIAGVVGLLVGLALFLTETKSVRPRPHRHFGRFDRPVPVEIRQGVEVFPAQALPPFPPAPPPSLAAQQSSGDRASAIAQRVGVTVVNATEQERQVSVLRYDPNGTPPRQLSSNAYVDKSQAENELLEQIAGYIVAALELEGVDTSDWSPDRSLLKKSLVRQSTVEPIAGPNDLPQCRVKMNVDLSPTKIEQARQWLVADRSWYRTKGTAQAYAGAVLMLGGIAIFLRLGTARRPNE